MKEKDTPKLPAAVSLGRRGGKQTAKKYGIAHFQKMGGLAAVTKAKRYGKSDFYTLIRFGLKPSEMTAKEREEALAKIESDRSLRQKRKTQ